ncbi:hypothetical protein [Methylobacterium ajmalii]|uniref:hypothetical protein n=1 Tax=Methylobacterium ajmalii TaxID=2738439 RepID=UPI002F358E5F
MPTISFVIPTWMIPLALTVALYGALTLWVNRQSSSGIGAAVDGFFAGIGWVVGSLVIWIAYLVLLLAAR